MKRLLFLMIATIMFAIQGWSQGEITIGSGTSTTSYVPMHCNYDYSYTQTIYSSSEIMGGTISQIAYYMTSTSARTEDIVIYAGNTTKTAFVSNTDFEALANLTQVFSGSVTFNHGWNYITLTTPFLYNGIDNLLIAIDKNTGNYASRSWQSHTSSFASCLYYYQDDNDIDPSAPAASNKGFSSSRPNTRFVITPTDPGFCFAPSNLAYSNVLPNQATITWDANIDVASYLIEYKTSSQEWSDATLIPGISGNTHVITNLNANTQYNIRVTPECTSALSSIISLRTACETITQFPWIEDFENDFNTVAVAPGNKPAPYCWFVIDSLNTSSYYWQRSTSSNNGNGAAYMYGFTSATTTSSSYNNNDWLISPIITLTGNERLNFWSKKSSSSYYPDLLVYAMDVSAGDLDATASNSNFVLIGQIDSTLLSTTYSEFEFNLSTLVGDYRLAFVRKKIANGNVYIDDLKISAFPTCFPPTDLVMLNLGSDQVEIAWEEANATDNAWEIIIENLSTNTIETIQATASPHTLTALIPNTRYSVYMRTDCGDGTFSDPTLPISFQTNCTPVTLPYSEYFQSSIFIEPTCWTRMSGLLDSTLSPSTSGWFYATVLDTVLRANVWGTSFNYWVISPSLDLGDGTTQYQVEMDVALSAYSGAPTSTPAAAPDDKFAVVVSLDNGLTWSSANATIWYDGDSDLDKNYSNFGPAATHITIKLLDSSQQPYTGICKIGIYAESTVSNGDNYMYIDNFSINEIPLCPEVYNVDATALTFTSMKVNFSTDNAEEGGTWELAYGTADDAASFDPSTATIIPIASASEVPYIINSLTSGSKYFVSVRQACGGAWSQLDSVIIPNIEPVQTLPYIQNFNDLSNISEWTFTNPDTNKWFIGSVINHPEETGNALYISDSLGLTHRYYRSSQTYAYASALIDFGTSPAAEYTLSFDWMGGGESSYDYLRVYTLPIDQSVPETEFPVGGSEIINRLNLQADWQTRSLLLPASQYQNSMQRLVFVWRNDGSSGTQPPVAIDNISIIPQTCASVSNIVIDTTTASSATLSWTENGTATSWLVEYSLDGTTWLSQTATTNSAFILSPLDHSSLYQVRITAECSPTDYSMAVTSHFSTACGAITELPWEESFENIGAAGNLPTCFVKMGATASKLTTSIGSASNNRFARTGNNYAYFVYGCWNRLFTPEFDLTAGVNYKFSFYYVANGSSGWQELSASLYNDVDTTTVVSAIGTPITTGITNTTYEKYSGIFTVPTSGTYNIGIFAKANGTPWYLTIDDLHLEIACLDPTALTASNISQTTADIEWTAGENETTWEVRLGLTGTPVEVTNASYQLTDLTPGTNNTVYVRAVCGVNHYSEWVPLQFQTEHTPPTVVTSPVTAITQTTATLNGTFTAGTRTILAKGFAWKEATATTWTMQPVTGTTLTYNLAGLTANTSYEVKAYARTSADTTYGATITFTTVNPPTVVTSPVTAITQTSATLDGTITAGSETITAQGFEWKETSATTWINQAVTGAALTYNLTNLTADITYEVRAYAMTSIDTTYGATITFTTVNPPTVVTSPVTAITQTSATLDGTITAGSETITAQGFEWKETSATTWINQAVTGAALTYNLTNLTADITYEVRAYAMTSIDTTYGATITFTTVNPPTVVTSPVTAITQTSATLDGTITAGSETITAQGFEWKETSATTWINQAVTGATLTYNLTGLTPNTAYEVRAYAMTAIDTTYGTTQTFTTLAIVPPTVVTSPITIFAQTTATLDGTITAGSETITAQGFEWKETSATTWINQAVTGATLTYNLTGLTPNTAYEVRAYAMTAIDTTYGTTQTFTTLAIVPPIVVTNPADQIAQTIATLNGSITAGTDEITAQGFEWKETSATDWNVVNATGSTITYNLTGLTANTNYEFKAFATTAEGTEYGSVVTFATLAHELLTVTTDSVDNLEDRSVTLYGTIILGTEELTAQGFEWKAVSDADWTTENVTLSGDILTFELTGLNPNTVYEFKAFAATASGNNYGDVINFTTLGLNEVQGSEMSIVMYPNPTSNQTNLIVNGVSGDAKIIISDMQGRILNTTNVKAANGVIEQTIDVSNLAKGVYYVRIQNNQLSRTQKLIVK